MKLQDIEKADGLRAYRVKLLAMKTEVKTWHDDQNTDLFIFGPEVFDPLDNKTLSVDVRDDGSFRAVIYFLHTLTKLAEQDLRKLGVVIPEEEGEEEL